MKSDMQTIRKFAFLVVLLFSMLLFTACREKQKFSDAPAQTDALPSTEPDNSADKNPSDSEEREYTEGERYLQAIEGAEQLLTWLQEDLEKSRRKLYAEYSGERMQRIASEKDKSYSLAQCPDVVFCQAEQDQQPGDVIKEMIEGMILPLTENSDVRSYTITDYEIEEQELIPCGDDVWVIPFLDVYYRYEGIDFVSWEERLEYDSELQKDGLIPLEGHGSDSAFIFILMEEDGVYRLQLADEMLAFLDE